MLVGLRSRKHIQPFELVRPSNLEEACRALAEQGRGAVMAGGLDLIDRLKSGEAIDRIVQLNNVRELAGIRRDGDFITIGALTTHAQIAESALLADLLPDIPAVWRTIANPRVRLAGTLGGNLMSAMPHYDALPALLALRADAIVFDRHGAQSAIASPALRGNPGILAQVRVPIAPGRRWLLADRSLHPMVTVYLGTSVEADMLGAARVAVGCAYPSAISFELTVAGMPLAALGANAREIAQSAAASLPAPLDDGLAGSAYRRRMIEVLTRRLLIKLGSRS